MHSVLLLKSEGDSRVELVMDELSQLPAQVARLESDVDHIKKDVTDIKVDLRRIDDRLTGIDARLHQGEKSLGQVENGLGAKITEVEKSFELQITERVGELKLWVLGLYITQAASLLLIMAKGFKWF